MEYDFQTLERIVREVHHLGELTSLSSTPLHMTKNDENNEVDLSPAYVPFQLKEILSKRKSITLQVFTYKSPSVQGVGTDHCEVNVNTPPKRQKHLSSSVEVECAKISLQLKGSSKDEEYEIVDLCGVANARLCAVRTDKISEDITNQ